MLARFSGLPCNVGMASFDRLIRRSMRTGIAAAGCLFAIHATLSGAGHNTAAAQPVAVDLELVLAVDVSGSIDTVEAKLQREGYMGALASEAVIAAIQSGILGRIALSYVEWAGYEHQATLVDWQVIASRADAEAFVAALAAAPLRRARRTSISGAIEYASPMFAANAIESTRQVIDISADGPNNSGPLVSTARDLALAQGIVINGLPIINDRPNPFGLRTMRDLDLYFKNCVIGGPGAFIVVAESFDDFASAVLSKLILEISDSRPEPNGLRRLAAPLPAPAPALPWLEPQTARQPLLLTQGSGGGLPAPPRAALPPGIANCDVGEQQWQQFRQGPDSWP
jgi:hypothetical protein